MKVKIATPYNRLHLTVSGVKIGSDSLTVPDQSLSIREIIERTKRGYPVDGEKTVFYNGEDDDMPDIRRMDLTELHDLQNWTKQRIKIAEDEKHDNYRKAQAKKTEEYYREKFLKENPPAQGDNPPQRGGDTDILK